MGTSCKYMWIQTSLKHKQISQNFIPWWKWLALLIGRFACNTRVIVDASSNLPVSNVKSLKQEPSIFSGKSHPVAVWQTQALRLKIRDSHLTCKVTNKFLSARERVEVVEWNKRWSPLLPCCPVNNQCMWRKPW